MKKNLELNEFTDCMGRTWAFRITAKHALKLKNLYNFDVRDIENPDRVSEMLDSSDMIILDMMACVLSDQVESRQITCDDLFSSLDGDSLPDAILAFMHGVIFFFPSHRRKAAQAMVSLVQMNQNRSGFMLTQLLENPEAMEAVVAAQNQNQKKNQKKSQEES